MSESVTKYVDQMIGALLFTKFEDILGMDPELPQVDRIDRSVIQAPRETALRKIAEKRGEDFLEFINYWRVMTAPAWDRQRTPLARRGVWLTATDGGKLRSINVKAQPMNLSFNAWFWSKDLDKVYQCIEQYIFWQQNYPKVDLTYTFDENKSFSYSPELHFGEIDDESTVHTEFQTGTMFIWRMPIGVDAWALQSDPLGTSTITKIKLTVYDKDSLTSYSEIIVPDSNQNTTLATNLKFSTSTLYGILSVSLQGNSIVIPNDRHDDFTIGDRVRVVESTSNDNSYVVASVALADGNTVLGLTGSLVDTTADGSLYKVS